jgi:hypothetical protein
VNTEPFVAIIYELPIKKRCCSGSSLILGAIPVIGLKTIPLYFASKIKETEKNQH